MLVPAPAIGSVYLSNDAYSDKRELPLDVNSNPLLCAFVSRFLRKGSWVIPFSDIANKLIIRADGLHSERAVD
jgi:hypothetical protein